MKKIILASNSAQRKKLLKKTGLKFLVMPSHAKEHKNIRTTCSAFVKSNALLKAENVAARLKKGIVIGADTVVYSGRKKIIGKPRSLKEAKRILKQLFSQPHWVYTGVAIIDAETNQTMIDYEKTMLTMNHLNDEEIDRYHKKMSPLDKAGGFDIEGHGGLFIRKIKGCYTNVIGLPMPKLRIMLKKFGISLMTLLMAMTVSGCVTEYNLATRQEESLLYGTDKEIRIGDAVSEQFDKHYKINTDVDINQRVTRIFKRIIAVCDRKELIYTVKIIEDEKLNAVSLPGGYVYIFKGILDAADNDDQIAGVLAHEVGHIAAKHGMKRLQASYGFALLQLMAATSGSGKAIRGAQTAYLSMMLAYSREDEFQSDRLGVKYLKKAGFDPNEMKGFLLKLKEEQEKAPLKRISYWRTHPHIAERIAVVNQAISGKLEFRDYLNLTGNE